MEPKHYDYEVWMVNKDGNGQEQMEGGLPRGEAEKYAYWLSKQNPTQEVRVERHEVVSHYLAIKGGQKVKL